MFSSSRLCHLIALFSLLLLFSAPVLNLADLHGGDLGHGGAVAQESPVVGATDDHDAACGGDHCCSDLCSAALMPQLTLLTDAISSQAYPRGISAHSPPLQFFLKPPISDANG